MRRATLCATAASVVATLSLAASKDEARLRKVAYAYAACVVRKHHQKASEAIVATASNHAITHQLSQIVDADCLGSAAGYGVDMRFPNDTYQYALADALVNAEFVSRGDTSFADRLPLAQPEIVTPEQEMTRLEKAKDARQRKEVQDSVVKQNALAWISRYGECVVRRDPVNARYWLLTPAETAEETSRIKAMQPAFGSCLGSGTLRFTRTVIRGSVAVNYYRLAKATIVSDAGSAY